MSGWFWRLSTSIYGLGYISGLQQAADNEAELGSAKLDFTF